MNESSKESKSEGNNAQASPAQAIKPPSKPKDSLEELVQAVVRRAKDASPNLKTQLAGTFELFIRDRPYRVAFDFSATPVKILDNTTKTFDCVLEIDERTLMRIDRGELNSQLALLSEKVTVRGRAGIAVYFFNLLGE